MAKSLVFIISGLILCTASFGFRIQEISSPNPIEGSDYGISSATDGKTLVVSAPAENSDNGAVYVFELNGSTWDYVTRLMSGSTEGKFGYSVDVDGDTIVVGAWSDDNEKGAAYVFEYNTGSQSWQQVRKLTASDGEEKNDFEGTNGDRFGYSVAIDGDRIVVGAYYDDVDNTPDGFGFYDKDGSVYVFEKNAGIWPSTEDVKLYLTQRTTDDLLGFAVDISGDIIVAGAYGRDNTYTNEGAVYIYKWNGSSWGQSTLENPVPSSSAYFGRSVAISNDLIAICSYSDNGSLGHGSVTLFRWNGSGWEEEETRYSPEPITSYYFGSALCLEGNRLIAGDYGSTQSGSSSGSAYLFEWDGYEWSEGTALITGGSGDRMGSSVAISGDVVFVGAYRVDDGGVVDAGMVYALTICNYNLAGDLNDDCRVGLADLAILSGNWLMDCIENSTDTDCVAK